MDPEISKKVGDDPRLYTIEAYLTKKAARSSQMQYLKTKGVNFFLTQTNSSPDQGLTSSMVEKNKERFGSNAYKKKKTKTFFEIFLGALSDQMLIILMIAAVIQIVVEYFFSDERETFWLEGVSILLAVAVVSIVASVNDYEKQKQFEELNAIEESTNKFKGLRDGKTVEIHKNDVVVGDVLLIEGGSEFPADGIALATEEAVVDEGSITGEAIQKFKAPVDQCSTTGDDESPSSVLISGTSLTSGFVKMLVLVTGKDSASGKLNEQIFDEDNEEQTPLEIKLDKLVTKIGKLGVGTAILVFVALSIRLIISDLIPKGWSTEFIREILRYLILAISIIVVAIPEGLPLAVTLSLAYSVRQMLDEKNLVRKLASCQTMGGAHVICTDKTGTLTQNQMFVVEVWNGKLQDVSQFKKNLSAVGNQDVVLDSLALNTKALLEPKPQGSSTELALLKFIRDAAPEYYKKYESIKEKKVLAIVPFNSDRKRMSTLIEQNGKQILLHKGGVEIVIQACQSMEVNGQVQPLNRQEVERSVEEMAKKGHRVIALAYKEVHDFSEFPSMKGRNPGMEQSMKSQSSMTMSRKPKKDKSGGVLNIEKSGFILQMLIGIQDLPRPESKAAIKSCHKGGVVVIMVTGDNKLTARAIADQVGITEPGQNVPGLVRQGKQIEQLSPEQPPHEIENFLKNLKVLARSRPEHKYRLVQCIQKLNNVVAVTGDGTNDAPALMKADVGFSMGVKGTQIAKSASDIIIMDDNFNSIVRALIWGRNIYQSIRKFLQFQLTANIVACAISVISSIVIRQSVLSAIQMLWINMIMDSLASLALATEPPNGEELLERKPFEKREPLITKTMLKHILGQSIFQILMLLILLFLGQHFIPEYADEFDSVIGSDLNAKYYKGQTEGTVVSGMFYTLSGGDNYITYFQKYKVHSRHFTFIFTSFVMMQIFNFFNCRRIRDQHNILANPCSNWLYWLIVVVIFLLQWVITTFLNVFFKMYKYHGLTVQQWLFATLIGALALLVSQILRFLPICKPDDKQEEDPSTPPTSKLMITYRDQSAPTKEETGLPAILNENQNGEEMWPKNGKFNEWKSVHNPAINRSVSAPRNMTRSSSRF